MKIISRAGWGADEPSRSISSIPLPVPRLVLHHTVTKDEGTSSVLKVQRLHMGQGFSDIGYNWVYSPRTREVYEGRGPGVVGAHTRGYNTTAHALALLGDGRYDDLSPDNISDLAEFRIFHGQYGPDRFTHGHRDLVATACPGANFYACIPQINATPTDWFDMATKQDLREVLDEMWDTRLPRDRQDPSITGPSYRWIVNAVLAGVREQLATREGPATLSEADVDRIVDRLAERLAS